MAAAEITVELREVFLKDRPQSLYDISPKGTVPVLQLTDGTVIDESIDIMNWVLEQKPNDWTQNDIQLQNEMIRHNDQEFKQWLDKYKYHVRHPENTLQYYRDKCSETLTRYNDILEDQSYFISDSISISDAAIFPFVRQCANVDRSWFASSFQNAERWLEDWIQSDLFKRVMPKFDAWKPVDEPLLIQF